VAAFQEELSFIKLVLQFIQQLQQCVTDVDAFGRITVSRLQVHTHTRSLIHLAT
jgi:hypothetical protein